MAQYEKASRQDLAEQEAFEIKVIQEYMPQPLSETELAGLIETAMKETGASSVKEMSKVMGVLKPKVQGRVDMKVLSMTIKQRLSQ